jgi:uncharacterized protein (DUF885 family)
MRGSLIVLLAASLARAAEPASEDGRFLSWVDAYYREWAAFKPGRATEIGWHEHDGDLEDLSAAGIAKQRAWLHGWQDKLKQLDGKRLTPPHQLDLTALALSIESQLVALEKVQAWKHRPDVYTDVATSSIFLIIKRSFAPPEERLRSVIAREKKIPALLQAARGNLDGVNAIHASIALSEIPDTIEFFQRDVPSAFSSVKDPALLGELARAGAAVQKALGDYAAWLKTVPTNAPFAIGEAAYRAKLHADEMIDAPLDELLARGEAELHRLQAQFKATAAKIDAKKPFAEVQLDMQKDHPRGDEIIADTKARLAGLRKFLVEREIVSLPSEIMPLVEETPPFMRSTTMASMESPGPYETRAAESYYNVTLPEKGWSAAQVEDFLRGAYNRPLIDVVSIHEAFPGHYTQFLWMPKMESKVRKVEGVATNAEGWAHYCEQMLVDEGWGGGDPKVRLAQLQDALLRAARFVVGIKLHTRGMTFEQAIDFFHKEGFQSQKVAEMEAKRGTEDPTYLYYTLGKLEILKLRDDYKKKVGSAYTLRKFHDAFLGEGELPIPLVRRALLSE